MSENVRPYYKDKTLLFRKEAANFLKENRLIPGNHRVIMSNNLLWLSQSLSHGMAKLTADNILETLPPEFLIYEYGCNHNLLIVSSNDLRENASLEKRVITSDEPDGLNPLIVVTNNGNFNHVVDIFGKYHPCDVWTPNLLDRSPEHLAARLVVHGLIPLVSSGDDGEYYNDDDDCWLTKLDGFIRRVFRSFNPFTLLSFN